MKLYILSPSETVNPPSRSHSVVGDFCFLFLMSLNILRSLDIREHIVLQILELRLQLGFLQIAIRQHIIAETAVHRRIIDEATLMISCHNLVICRIEYHRALLLQQIHAEALVLIIQIHQAEKRRHYIHLHAQARILLLRNTRTEDDERNVVVRLRQLALALTHQLTMVCLNHEYRVLIPRLPACPSSPSG